MGVGTKIYLTVLAIVFTVATLAGMYQDVPIWLISILGVLGALLLAGVGFIVLGRRLMRGDFTGGAPVVLSDDEPASESRNSVSENADRPKVE